MLEKSFDLRSKDPFGFCVKEIERLDSESISACDKGAFSLIPDEDRPHAIQARKA